MDESRATSPLMSGQSEGIPDSCVSPDIPVLHTHIHPEGTIHPWNLQFPPAYHLPPATFSEGQGERLSYHFHATSPQNKSLTQTPTPWCLHLSRFLLPLRLLYLTSPPPPEDETYRLNENTIVAVAREQW